LKRFILIILLCSFAGKLLSFDVRLYDLFAPPSAPFASSFKQLENPAYLKWIIDNLDRLAHKDRRNLKVFRLRNIYTFLYWYVLPPDKKEKAVKLGLKFSEETTSLFPRDPDGWLWKGSFLGLYGLMKGVLNVLNLAPRGLSYLLKAYKLDKTYLHGEPAIVLAKTLYKLPHFPVSYGDPEKARKLLSEAISIDPDFPYGYVDLAELEAYEGNTLAALSYLTRLDDLHPRSWYAKIVYHWTLKVLPFFREQISKVKWHRYRNDFFDIPVTK